MAEFDHRGKLLVIGRSRQWIFQLLLTIILCRQVSRRLHKSICLSRLLINYLVCTRSWNFENMLFQWDSQLPFSFILFFLKLWNRFWLLGRFYQFYRLWRHQRFWLLADRVAWFDRSPIFLHSGLQVCWQILFQLLFSLLLVSWLRLLLCSKARVFAAKRVWFVAMGKLGLQRRDLSWDIELIRAWAWLVYIDWLIY